MPRIPIHTIDSAPEESRGTLAAISKRMGKTLNIHAGMAHSPVVLATYAAMSGAVGSLLRPSADILAMVSPIEA